MSKQHFFLKLNPCRPDFAQTMTDAEKNIMHQHAAYWKSHMNAGTVLVFGPVLDPKATYGIGLVAVDDEEQLNAFIGQDPARKINQYEYYPMLAVVLQTL